MVQSLTCGLPPTTPSAMPPRPAQDTPNKIFIGGLPCEWFEEQVGLVLGCWGSRRWCASDGLV